MQREIKTNGPLHLDDGSLSEVGFAKKLIKTYDRNRIKASKLKIKEWDYYLIQNENYGVALTIADNGYMGLLSASFLDFSKKTEITKSEMTLFPLGKTHLSPSSGFGSVRVETKKVKALFETSNKKRKLHFEMKKFDGKNDFVADFSLLDEPKDSMVIATPFKDKPKCFYYNQKIIGMKAEGTLKIGQKIIEFSPINAFALLDWGRGVWTYQNTWLWSAAMGWNEGKIFGFNLGYGFGDNKETTENMLFFDGVGHKIEQVLFNIPKTIDGKDDFLSKWTFTSSDKRVELNFTPILNRHSFSSALVISSNQNQIFGKFDGEVVLDDGKKLKIQDLLGFAEKVTNKW